MGYSGPSARALSLVLSRSTARSGPEVPSFYTTRSRSTVLSQTCSSLPRFGALRRNGSLSFSGALRQPGSLSFHGALDFVGSLSLDGALRQRGSLTFCGALISVVLAHIQRRSPSSRRASRSEGAICGALYGNPG